MSAILHCRSCQSQALLPVLNLGRTALANALLSETQLHEPEAIYPLELVWCPTCTLLQISENVPADILFRRYFYQSSFSDTFLHHCETLTSRMIDERQLTSNALVIDIASNDGYLLQYYKQKNIRVLGFEPATNIAAIAENKGIPTQNDFFTSAEAQKATDKGLHADVIHAHNVMPHVADQRDFAQGIATLLKRGGTAVIEFAYAIDTINHTEFDQIYHEHMCYFSLTSFVYLCQQFGLTAERVERLSIHGGSLRVFLTHTSDAIQDESVTQLLKEEKAWGVDTAEPYIQFAKRTAALKQNVMRLLRDIKSQNKRIVVYGASAKGSTLMHYCDIDSTLVDFIVDRSTIKQGHFSPGTHLRIEPVKKLLEKQPDYVLLLTWNFAQEIMKQQAEYARRGGKFIIPIPRIRIL